MKSILFANMNIDLLNNREKAVIIWIIISFLLLLSFKSTRGILLEFAKTLVARNTRVILYCFVTMFVYMAAIALALCVAGFSAPTVTKVTLFWYFGVGCFLLFNVDKATKEQEQYFRKALVKAFALTAFIEIIMNVYSFSLWIEIILLPILTIIVVMSTFAETDKKYSSAAKMLQIGLASIGFFFLGYTIYELATNPHQFATSSNLQELVLLPLLTLACLPFIYCLAVIMDYSTVFRRIEMSVCDDATLTRTTKRTVVKFCGIRLKKLNWFIANHSQNISKIWNPEDLAKLKQEIVGDYRLAKK